MPIINETIISGVNAKDATASSADILQNKTAVVGKELIIGTMPEKAGLTVDGTFDSGSTGYITGKIPQDGHYSISSKLKIPVSNLSAGNIRNGVNVGGVRGTYAGTTTVVGNPLPTSNATQCLYLRQTENKPVTVSTPYDKYMVYVDAGSKVYIAKISGMNLVNSWTWYLYYGKIGSTGGNIITGCCSKQSDGSYKFNENDGSGGYVAFTIDSSTSITFIKNTTFMPVIFNA